MSLFRLTRSWTSMIVVERERAERALSCLFVVHLHLTPGCGGFTTRVFLVKTYRRQPIQSWVSENKGEQNERGEPTGTP